MSKSLNEWGRFLALVLRHKPQTVGIELDAHGWAQVEALLVAFNRIEAFNMLMLEQIVAEDGKQRFAFSEDKKRIRANQGHSVKVDVELREVAPPEILYHGTAVKYVTSINRQGLIAKQRLYVHLSANVETAHNVGKRHGEPFIYAVLAGEMARAGYKFYLSANGVWLTECVPKKFLRDWKERLIMKFDDFDKRMRVYEQSIDQYIVPGMYTAARLDGRSFTKLTREICKFEAPFDTRFRNLMVDTTKHIMNCGFKVLYGYTESDEISLLFSPDNSAFANKVRKINTILAGEASGYFSLALGKAVCFDCRVVPLPNIELVKDYFLWRQEDANRNALNSWCYWTLRKEGLSKNEATQYLRAKSVAFKNELLFARNINYNDVPQWQKRGVGVYSKEYIRQGYNPISGKIVSVKRKSFEADYELPIAEKYSAFIGSFLAAKY